ncbi:MAG TPA: hypothetical protein VE029_13315 [Rhizobacter sp.]|nr:hypothetical protein [Rhizobacter sp.]
MSKAVGASMLIETLMTGVQSAFRALVPIATDLGVKWHEPDNYLDWDSVAGGIFEGFVLAAIRSSAGWSDCLALVDYDKRVSDYTEFSYVGIESQGTLHPLVCFATTDIPFDTCVVAELRLDQKVARTLRLPFGQCRFLAVGRLRSGQMLLADTIKW